MSWSFNQLLAFTYKDAYVLVKISLQFVAVHNQSYHKCYSEAIHCWIHTIRYKMHFNQSFWQWINATLKSFLPVCSNNTSIESSRQHNCKEIWLYACYAVQPKLQPIQFECRFTQIREAVQTTQKNDSFTNSLHTYVYSTDKTSRRGLCRHIKHKPTQMQTILGLHEHF